MYFAGITNALEKHFSKKHPGNGVPANTDILGYKQAPKVYRRLLRKCDQYFEWLAELVVCLNSAHSLVVLVSRFLTFYRCGTKTSQ